MNGMDEKIGLRIKTLTIEDCLGCNNVKIAFPEDHNVHLLLFKLVKPNDDVSSTSQIITPVGQALKLLCNMEYATAESLQRLPLLQIGKGCVKMSFRLIRLDDANIQDDPNDQSDLDMEPSTSKQAQMRFERRQKRRTDNYITYEVTVVRRFDDVHYLERVMVQINSGNWDEFSFADFHDIFFATPQHTNDILNDVNKNCVMNWLHILQADTDCYSKLNDGNPFETFAKLFDHPDYEHQQLLEHVATNYLAANEAMRLNARRFVLNIFEQVRQIFEFITVYEYSVWFFVPRLNRFTPLDHVTVDDLDLRSVRTSIKLSRDKTAYFFHQADHNIMDLLLVAFQMALAKASNQTVLFLGHLEKLADYVNMQYMKAYFMNTLYAKGDSSPQWICNRYLNRMIDVAKSLGLVVIIEYPCGKTLLADNREVFKCIQQEDNNSGAISWQVFSDVNNKSDSGVEQLTKIMKFN